MSDRIIHNMLKRSNYSIIKKENITVNIRINAQWIPFESDEPQRLKIKVAESHNTNILLQEVWNRGNDIYFSFHTTYKLDYKRGSFLYNMLINEDGTYTSVGSNQDFKLNDLNGNEIQIGQIGFGPGSDFSFGINPDEYEKLRSGFIISYSGLVRYEYSRK